MADEKNLTSYILDGLRKVQETLAQSEKIQERIEKRSDQPEKKSYSGSRDGGKDEATQQYKSLAASVKIFKSVLSGERIALAHAIAPLTALFGGKGGSLQEMLPKLVGSKAITARSITINGANVNIGGAGAKKASERSSGGGGKRDTRSILGDLVTDDLKSLFSKVLSGEASQSDVQAALQSTFSAFNTKMLAPHLAGKLLGRRSGLRGHGENLIGNLISHVAEQQLFGKQQHQSLGDIATFAGLDAISDTFAKQITPRLEKTFGKEIAGAASMAAVGAAFSRYVQPNLSKNLGDFKLPDLGKLGFKLPGFGQGGGTNNLASFLTSKAAASNLLGTAKELLPGKITASAQAALNSPKSFIADTLGRAFPTSSKGLAAGKAIAGLTNKALYAIDTPLRVGLRLVDSITKHRGLSAKAAANVHHRVNLIDQSMTLPVVGQYSRVARMLGMGFGLGLPGIAGYLPFAAATYTGYSALRNPLAVAKAAHEVLLKPTYQAAGQAIAHPVKTAKSSYQWLAGHAKDIGSKLKDVGSFGKYMMFGPGEGGMMKGLWNKIWNAPDPNAPKVPLGQRLKGAATSIGKSLWNALPEEIDEHGNKKKSSLIRMLGRSVASKLFGKKLAGAGAGAAATAAAGTGEAVAGGAAAGEASAGILTGLLLNPVTAIITAVVAVSAALIALPFALDKFASSVLDSQKYLADFSGAMAAVFARREVFQTLQNIRVGNATAGSAGNLEKSWEKLSMSLEPIKIALTNFMNNVLAKILDGVTAMVDMFRKVLTFLHILSEDGKKKHPVTMKDLLESLDKRWRGQIPSRGWNPAPFG